MAALTWPSCGALSRCSTHFPTGWLRGGPSTSVAPWGIVRAALAACRMPRFLRWQGACSRPIVPTRGVAAGFPRAQLWAQLSLLVGADGVARNHPAATLRIYADDVTVSAEAATDQACCDIVASAARQMRGVIENELGGEIALSKAAVVASHQVLVTAIRRQLDECAGLQQRTTVPPRDRLRGWACP